MRCGCGWRVVGRRRGVDVSLGGVDVDPRGPEPLPPALDRDRFQGWGFCLPAIQRLSHMLDDVAQRFQHLNR